jgi:N-acetylneuraminic acid mutarotase
MKNIILLLAVFISSVTNFAQNFTWVKGNNTSGLPGTYGTQSVSAPANNPGGRHGCGKWVDAAGNLWLFGGEGYSNNTTLCWMNDLWKYTIATNEWTWIRGSNGPNQTGSYGAQGVPASTNEPGAREFMACWTDASGNFWMFGGDGFAATASFGRLGDLWRYNPTTNQWTWMKGFNQIAQSGVYGTLGTTSPTNLPGGRYGAGSWTDPSGDFWMFGGRGYGSGLLQGYLNDLWKYNIASNQWTWVCGSNTNNQNGVYGTLSVPSPVNIPGGKYFPTCWSDASGNMYMFGGYGYSTVSVNYLNDLWKYNPVTNQWTWINGSSGSNATGVYGTLGIASALNIPGSRFSSAGWKDVSGNFWLFGGHGYASINNGELNDLFKYNPITNQWTWMKGSNTENQNGAYGTIGVSSASNMPGAREYNTWWKDLTSKFWLFGGEGHDATSTPTSVPNHMNDLWSFSVPCNPDSIISNPGKIVCSGTSVTLTAINGGASTVWYPTAASTNSISGGSVLSLPSLTVAGTQTVYSYYAEANSCTVAPRASISITVNPVPTLSVSSSQTLLCKSYQATLTVSGANSYTWNTIPISTNGTVFVSPLITTTYVVVGKDNLGCENSTSFVLKVVVCPGLAENNSDVLLYSLFPNPSKDSFTLKLETVFQEAEFEVMNTQGKTVFKQTLISNLTNIQPSLAKGIYFYRLRINEKEKIRGKLIIE